MNPSPWIRRVETSAPFRLVCLPYAGGGTVDYRGWADALIPGIDLCPVVLPGRETRLSERPHDDLGPLVDALLTAIAPTLRLAPFAIYGHSMGAWIAFELVRALRRAGRPLPVHLFVAARRAPHRPARLPALSALPEPAFVDAVQQRYQAIPDAVRAQPDLMRLVIPALRADFTLLDRYRYRDEPPLQVPMTALLGAEDRVEEPADVRAWSEHAGAGFTFATIPGGHFFLREGRDELVDRLNAVLRPAIPRH